MKQKLPCTLFLILLFQICRVNALEPKIPPLGIVGGLPTTIDEFPFMVALGWLNNATGHVDYLGGGMLIAPNYVLTAAHCVLYEGELPTVLQIGGNNLNEEYLFNERSYVETVFLHPDYKKEQAYDDIAIIQLKENSTKPPVCLWTESGLNATEITAIGYGSTEFAGYRTNDLLKVDLSIVPDRLCGMFFKRQRKFRKGLLQSQICAGDANGRKDTCQGDSGGPMVVHHNGKPFAVGITSIGLACSGFPPAVYTRISAYTDWINSITNQEFDPLACAI